MLRAPHALCCILFFAAAGCCHPSEDNIRLRKINQDLTAKAAGLTTQKEADDRTIAGLLARSPSIPVLPGPELKNFFVTAGIKFGRLTGGVDLDPAKPGVEAIRVYINTVDDNDHSIQAAGSFVVEAFDLAAKGNNRLGKWTWDAVAAKAQWRSFLFDFCYELTCPWKIVPRHPDITLRVTFTDELTHIPFTAEKMIHVDIPPPPIPTTAPTTTANR
ncbi:MAG TPA: hypothetical protein VG326_08705 [Tepidisphaeraceae bacterium]|jgi:hypothetical protein|nr:hypothetical protein [Tepidisphaeraceae bacterium]